MFSDSPPNQMTQFGFGIRLELEPVQGDANFFVLASTWRLTHSSLPGAGRSWTPNERVNEFLEVPGQAQSPRTRRCLARNEDLKDATRDRRPFRQILEAADHSIELNGLIKR